MDEQRIELLKRHKGHMPASLLGELDRYEDFIRRVTPKVVVLCADNHLRMEMEQVFAARTDMDAEICGTFDDNIDLFEIMLSDAVIAVSAAKTIAPKGLFQTIQSLKQFEKEVYFILGRWSSMIKTEEMALSRKKRVLQEYPDSKIVCVMNSFESDIPGFDRLTDIANHYAAQLCSAFSRQHEKQVEKLYAFLQTRVEAFYEEQRKRVQSEEMVLRNVERIVGAKQARFAIVLPHVSQAFQKVIDQVAEDFSGLSVGELENDIEDVEQLLGNSWQEAEKTAKQALIKCTERIFEEYRNKVDNDVHTKTQAIVDEALSEMQQVTVQVHAKLQDDAFREELEAAVTSRQRLDRIVEEYDRLCMLLIEKARWKITAYIYAFELRYEKPWGHNLKQLGDRLASLLDIILTEPEDDDRTVELRRVSERKVRIPLTEDVDSCDDNDPEKTGYEQFRNAMKTMINSLSESAAGVLYTCADEARTEITQIASQLMDGYFTEILSVLQKMEINLAQIQKTYVME